MAHLTFTGKEIEFSPSEIIVSKTDLKGRITYANQTFCEVSRYKELDLLGKPHNIIRHANMPRCIFKLVWDKLQSGQEVFGYVVNRTADNDYYWVLAHLTPSFDNDGEIVGYHSNRRVPDRRIINTIISPLYAELLQIETRSANQKDGMMASCQMMIDMLNEKGITYDEFVLTL